ncbi:MAG: hypothetical protein NXI21_01935 [Alphaproteobacteria bacterium]|nr:hypothetical protein [Alphaproteobacteria bacterium]
MSPRTIADRLRYRVGALRQRLQELAVADSRLSYQLSGLEQDADELEGTAGADDNVVDLQTRRALETVAPGRDPASLRFGEGLRAPRDPRVLGRPPWRPDPSEPDPKGSGGAA